MYMCSLKTVGLTNIFKASADKQKECLQTISATIEQDAIFLFLPDPISCYNHAIFKQSQSYRLHHGASLVFIDWYVAGRQVSFCHFFLLWLYFSYEVRV